MGNWRQIDSAPQRRLESHRLECSSAANLAPHTGGRSLCAASWLGRGLGGLCCALLLWGGSEPSAIAQEEQLVDEVQISVNGRSLTRREIVALRTLRELQLRALYKGEALEEQLRESDKNLRSQLVEQLLLEDYAQQLNIRVKKNEVDQQIETLWNGVPKIREQIDREALREILLRNLLRQRVVQRTIDARIVVAENEIRSLCSTEQQENREVDLGHILLRQQGAESERRLSALAERLRAGEDFESLARAHSEDPSVTQNGGRLGFMRRGQLVPSFEKRAFALKPGEIAVAVQTRFGLHLIQVFDERIGASLNCEALETTQRAGFYEQIFKLQREERLRALLKRLSGEAEVEVFSSL